MNHHWLGPHGDEPEEAPVFEQLPPLGEEQEERISTPLDDTIVHKLEDLDVPVPQPIEIDPLPPRWLNPGDGVTEIPPHLAELCREEGVNVINSDEDLRHYVEERGYALVKLTDLDKVQITEDGPRLKSEEPKPAGVNPKDAIGLTKPDLSLVPPAGQLYQAQAMMDGARKYGPYNWRENPVLMMVYISACQRHLAQLLDGEDFDPISGVHHLGHALACLGILADARETGNLVDNRPLPGAAGAMIRHFGDHKSFDGRK